MSKSLPPWRALNGAQLFLRPMRLADAASIKTSLNLLSADARRQRFFRPVAEFSDEMVTSLVDFDARTEYAVVVLRLEGDQEVPVAGGRFIADTACDGCGVCEFSLIVGDAWHGQGIGRRILKSLMREASRRGLREMVGYVLSDNRQMIALARSLRFQVMESDEGPSVYKLFRDLPRPTRGLFAGLARRVFRRGSRQ